jgi:RimJ/RimL family protein N-acetyltransferase
VPDYQPMTFHLSTKRLRLRPWAESDVDEYRALVTERGNGVPSVAGIRERIATQLAATAQTGLALLPICRRLEGDFIGYCGLIVGRSSIDEPEIAYELFQRVHTGAAMRLRRPVRSSTPRSQLGGRDSGRR